MTHALFSRVVSGLAVCGFAAIAVGIVTADSPEAPKLSAVASVEALNAAAAEYLADIQPLVADEGAYKAGAEQAAQKANALVALAQVLGNHDGASPYKAGAAEMMTAAATLSRAKDFASAKAAWGALDAASKKTDPGATPKWEKAARLGMLMEEVQVLNNDLRRGLRRIERNKEAGARDAAVLAAFAQAALYDTHEVKNPADLPKWSAMMSEMHDAATELSGHFAAADEPATTKSLDRLEKSCATCHDVFHNE